MTSKERTTRRRRVLYSHQRILLILLMGSKCRYCQERRPDRLEFHHVVKANWTPTKTSRLRRIRLYAKDWADGKCVLACGPCNKKQGSPVNDEPDW